MSAPGRIRTCDLQIRNPMRFPLRYGGLLGRVYYLNSLAMQEDNRDYEG